MALRRFASDASLRLGLRIQAGLVAEQPNYFGLLTSRAFATVEQGLKYAKSHEWAKIDSDTATVGISDFAQAQLGDIVFVELPEVGAELEKEGQFGVVESVKAASDVYSPVTGEVTEVNEALNDSPDLVNSDAFGEGWIMKVKLSNPSEADSLLDSSAYEKLCEEEDH